MPLQISNFQLSGSFFRKKECTSSQNIFCKYACFLISFLLGGNIIFVSPVSAQEQKVELWKTIFEHTLPVATSVLLPFPFDTLAPIILDIGFQQEPNMKTFFLKGHEKMPVSFSKEGLDAYIPQEETILSIWLLGDSADVFQKDFYDFERRFPHITVRVTSFLDQSIYFSEMKKAFLRGESPDIFLVNNEWAHSLNSEKRLAFAPREILSSQEIKNYFHPLAQEFIQDGNVLAAPLYGNFLVMMSNRTLLTDDRVFIAERPGKTWTELLKNLEKFNEFGNTKVIPISLGLPKFSEYTFDIFLLLLHQSNAQEIDGKNAKDALLFLFKFAHSKISSIIEGNDVERFIKGQVAVIFGNEKTYSALTKSIREKLKPKETDLKEENLQLHLLPQLHLQDVKTIGSIWGLAVSHTSKNPEFSWALATSLTDEQKSKEHFLKTHQTPLLKSISNGIFSESAAVAVTGGKWQRVDFRAFFVENVEALLSQSDNTEVSLEETLSKFSDFFSS